MCILIFSCGFRSREVDELIRKSQRRNPPPFISVELHLGFVHFRCSSIGQWISLFEMRTEGRLLLSIFSEGFLLRQQSEVLLTDDSGIKLVSSVGASWVELVTPAPWFNDYFHIRHQYYWSSHRPMIFSAPSKAPKNTNTPVSNIEQRSGVTRSLGRTEEIGPSPTT